MPCKPMKSLACATIVPPALSSSSSADEQPRKRVRPRAIRHIITSSSEDELSMPPPLSEMIAACSPNIRSHKRGRPRAIKQIISNCNGNELTLPHAAVNDYVLLKLQPQGSHKLQPIFYVGFITFCNDEDFTIQCMRRHKISTNSFTFPDNADIHVYSRSQFVCVLNVCKENRGIYYFSDDLSPFAHRLH
jgi:hypothetical protein